MAEKRLNAERDCDGPLDIELSQMAALVESQLAAAVEAFERRDIASAERIIETDARIDAAHFLIEEKVLAGLAEAPLLDRRARDIIMIMKVAGDLERVGDLAKNVAKRTLVVARETYVSPAFGVNRMGRGALRQLSDVLNAYSSRNAAAAKAVWSADDDLDQLYNSVFQQIVILMMEDASRINACTHLGFIAKNFERVGDHATNIAEALFFAITGEPLAQERPKGDDTAVTKVAPPKPD